MFKLKGTLKFTSNFTKIRKYVHGQRHHTNLSKINPEICSVQKLKIKQAEAFPDAK